METKTRPHLVAPVTYVRPSISGEYLNVGFSVPKSSGTIIIGGIAFPNTRPGMLFVPVPYSAEVEQAFLELKGSKKSVETDVSALLAPPDSDKAELLEAAAKAGMIVDIAVE